MQYLLSIIVAGLLVLGQTLWKVGLTGLQLDQDGSLLKKLSLLITNPHILGGAFIYGIATLLYFYIIGRYEYATSYAIIVSLSLIFATSVAFWLFQEKIGPINLVGFGVIIVGIILVLKK